MGVEMQLFEAGAYRSDAEVPLVKKVCAWSSSMTELLHIIAVRWHII
jgi:hypothetical protein